MTDIVRRETDSWIEVAGPTAALAEQIARTPFVPKGFQGQPYSVMAAMLTGREMGLGPMASLRGLHVVEGKPSLTADMLAARIIAAGHRITWEESSATRCTVLIERADRLSEARVTWTIADAQAAGLSGKQVWRQYPRRMLQHRALTEAAAMACPDVVLGLDVGDDVGDNQEPPRVVQVTQAQPPTLVEVAHVPTPPLGVGAEQEQPAPEVAEPDMITPAQMRMIGALIGRLETAEGRKLDRNERRRLIGFMAGFDDPGSLESAKGLTREQASTAIDALQAQVITAEAEAAAETAEVVEAEVAE
jgi:hypothetical protein